ncbi:hypothetical protein [Psilogramma increta granulovirus]|uniref:Uncharacterized protein n=1 Tax=Psilogramma increta granulovirus TaxID=2953508 RepID=A0A977TNX6_9BBAC|nr:hypothetical protein [Psilogramma increta granulovirus]
MQSSLVPFGGNNTLRLKQTHHHYCGFFSLDVLATIIDDVVVIDDKQHTMSNSTAIDWAFDGEDTIVTEKRLLYTNEELPLHSPIFNIENKLVGLVLRGVQTLDNKWCYAIQDGFTGQNFHLSNVDLVVREKRKLISYADKQFDTKHDLVKYIDSVKNKLNSNDIKNYGAILYHVNKKNAQLVLFQNGVQFLNCHLRKSIYGVL